MKKFLFLSLMLMLAFFASVFATSIVPDSVGGNPNCGGIKIDPPISTIVTLECGAHVTVALSIDGKYLDWSSDVPLTGTIIMKGGPSAFLYNYTSPTSGDTGLRCPYNLGGNIPQISHYEFCMICAPTGKFTVGIKDELLVGKLTLGWTDYKTGSQDEGCPGTYQAKGKVVIDTTAGQSVLRFDVSGQVVVTYECDEQYPPMAFSSVKDSLFAKINGIWQLVGQNSFDGMTLACDQSWTGNFVYNFVYQTGMTKLKKVDVAYYGESQSVRFEEEYDLPAPTVQNGCILVYHRWDGQSSETFLGQVCYTDPLPKVFNVDSTVIYDQPGEYSFKNYYRTSYGTSGEATHTFLIKECPTEKELELFKVWLLNGQEGVPPENIPEDFRVVATSDIDQLIYSKVGGVLAWRDVGSNLRNKLKYLDYTTINVIEENLPAGWINMGGLGQITPLNGKHYVYNSKEFTECDPDDMNVLAVYQQNGIPVPGVIMKVYTPVTPGEGDNLLTFNSDGSITTNYVGQGFGDYVVSQAYSFDYWYTRWGGSGNLLINDKFCWENKILPTRAVVFEMFAPQGQVFAINGKTKYTRLIEFDIGVPGFDQNGHVNIVPNFSEWYVDWVFELLGTAQFAANPVTFAGTPEHLVFLQGTPAYPTENWNNAVDGDLSGWDGTTTAKGGNNNPSGPAWATFKFADGKPRSVNGYFLQTGDPSLGNKYVYRQATDITLYTSQDGITYQLWARLKKVTDGKWHKYFASARTASYFKIVLSKPNWGDFWRQLVEFGVEFGQAPSYARTTTEDEVEISSVPVEFKLEQNYPNPFNPTTTIQFDLPTEGQVRLSVFDLRGRLVAELVNEKMTAGFHNITFDARDLPSGVYYYCIKAGKFQQMRKMTLLK